MNKNAIKVIKISLPLFQMRCWLAIGAQPIKSQQIITARPITAQPFKSRPITAQLVALLALLLALVPMVGTERRFYPSQRTEKEVIAVKEGRLILTQIRKMEKIILDSLYNSWHCFDWVSFD